jgi:selenocysteine lyase/cysteine desulfurase
MDVKPIKPSLTESPYRLDKLIYHTPGGAIIQTPFGERNSINADVTASGIEFIPITQYISNVVLPYYSNTHSNAHNGQLLCHYISQSKNLIRKSMNCQPSDLVIFTGNGCSGAINHLIHLLDIKTKATPESTLIIISITEHHSNYLPWKHLNATIREIHVLPSGLYDLDELQSILESSKHTTKIVSLSACSNVTGVYQETEPINKLVHEHNGQVFWDYAAGAPYLPIDFTGTDKNGYMDGCFVSPHKFVGGLSTPGLLVVRPTVCHNEIPYCPAGGTVRFVSDTFQKYSDNAETRETGGTPNIVGSIQTGLCFQLKDHLQLEITKREHEIVQMCDEFLKTIPNIKVLAPTVSHRLPIYPIIFEGLHYNLVVKLLNDLFGIQSRGGVSCCSVFAQYLLHLTKDDQKQIYDQILNNMGVDKKYGWVRVTFHYIMPTKIVRYILYAIKFVATFGKLFEQLYHYDAEKNHWIHNEFSNEFPSLDLFSMPYIDVDKVCKIERPAVVPSDDQLVSYFEKAQEITAKLQKQQKRHKHLKKGEKAEK